MASNAKDAVKSGDPKLMLQHFRQRSPSSGKVFRIGGALALITTVVVGGGIALLVASPVLLFFSPILVPLAILCGLAFGAFVAFLVFVSGVAWVYKYARGRHPVGSRQVDAAKHRIADTASHVSDKAREAVHNIAS